MPSAALLTIDLDALAANYRLLASLADGAETAPVVKADGYGLGAGAVARRLWAEGARTFFVARLSEGEALRAALDDRAATILVLDGLTPGSGARFADAGLTPVLNSLPQVSAAAALASGGRGALPVALQVDTGMNRQGVSPDEAEALVQGDRLARLDVGLVISHLGSAPEPAHPRNREQLARFRDVRALFPGARASLAASAGVFLGPDYRFDVVRPGISLYGGGPEERPDARLKAVARLEAPLLDIRPLKPGEALGYGTGVVADRPMRLGVVAAGYADGVLRASLGRAYAWHGGRRLPMMIVNMDLIALDLGDHPANVGEMVELLGPNALVDDLASAAGTVAHECLVRLGGRGLRRYVGETAPAFATAI